MYGTSSVRGLLKQRLQRRGAESKPEQVAEDPDGLATPDPRGGQRRASSRDPGTERPARHSRGQDGERTAPAVAPHAHPAMLGHLDARDDLRDLMGDRIAHRRLAPAELPAASQTRPGPMLNDPIRVGDHRPMTTLMAGLPCLLLARRPLLPRALRACCRSVARRRQAAVVRAAADQPLQLLNLRLHPTHRSARPAPRTATSPHHAPPSNARSTISPATDATFPANQGNLQTRPARRPVNGYVSTTNSNRDVRRGSTTS